MLYLALWDPPSKPARPKTALDHPLVRHFIENWGHKGDIGFIASNRSGESVGAIWTQLNDTSPGEGYGCSHPELGIAVIAKHQGRGVGSGLMKHLIEDLRHQASGLRLGVHPQNQTDISLNRKSDFIQYAVGAGEYPQMKLDFN